MAKKQSVQDIQKGILIKRNEDRKKLKSLLKLALISLLIRALIYILSIKITGQWAEILWIPSVLLLLSAPFYAFEMILDKIKKD